MIKEVVQSQLNKSRKDKFLLVLTLPKIFKDLNVNSLSVRQSELINQNSLQFSIFGSVVPQISVPAETAGYSGQSYKVSSHSRPPYEDITVNFTVDNKFNNYWVIYKWLDVLNDEYISFYNAKEPNRKLIAPANYQADYTIYGLDDFDKPIIKYTYTKAFPTNLGGIDYSYRDAGEIETSFSFAFSQFFAELI